MVCEENIWFYYTSRENTLILLDESHVSKLLATCVSIGSLTAVTIRRISARCQGDDVLAPVVKVPFHDSLYCWGRHAFKIPARGESISRPQQNTAVNNGIILLLGTTCASVSIQGKK